MYRSRFRVRLDSASDGEAVRCTQLSVFAMTLETMAKNLLDKRTPKSSAPAIEPYRGATFTGAR
jgi:hypothetical protein